MKPMWSLCLLSLVLLLSLGANCTPEKNAGATIGAAGGIVKSADGKLTLEIPAGALSAETAITIKATTSGGGDALTALVTYDMQPDGLSFAKAVKATLTLDPNQLPGRDLTQATPGLFLYTVSGEKIERLSEPVLTHNTDKPLTISAQLNHFSELKAGYLLTARELVVENVSNRTLQLKVGELFPLKAMIRQSDKLPEPVKSAQLVIQEAEFTLGKQAEGVIRLLGATQRGQNHKEPFHLTQGNVLSLTKESRGASLRMSPAPLIECLKPGLVSFNLSVSTSETAEFLPAADVAKPGERVFLVGIYEGGIKDAASVTISVACKEAAEKRKPTLPDATGLRRSSRGEVTVLSKLGVALHDALTHDRKRVVPSDKGAKDHGDVFDEDDDFDLTIVPDPKSPEHGKLSPTAHKADGSTLALNLNQAAKDASIATIHKVCPDKVTDPCRSETFVGVDKDGKIYSMEVKIKDSYKVEYNTQPVKDLSFEDLNVTWNVPNNTYNGLGVAKDGKVYHIKRDNAGAYSADQVGDVKAGKHALVCDAQALRCAIANFTERNLHFYLQNDVNQPPVETYSDKINEDFKKIDLRVIGKNTQVILFQPDQRGISLYGFKEDGKPNELSTFTFFDCPNPRDIIFPSQYLAAKESTDYDYVALCQEGTSAYLSKQILGDPPKVPPEPTTPQEDTTPDAGPDTTPPPDKGVDCSQYRAPNPDKDTPTWYAGDAEGKICKPMYDKVYGRNNQSITCKSDADCNNPCRHVCCRSSLFAEIVVCKGGICTFEVSNKCGACASGSGFGACGLPPSYTP